MEMGQKGVIPLDLEGYLVVRNGALWGKVAPNPCKNMPLSPNIVQKPLGFVGEFHPVLDQKKRLTIPARWRSDALQELFIIKSSSRACLAAMPQDVLYAMGENAKGLAGTVEDHQSFKDQFFASAVLCPIDSQGRMVLPDDLCRFAGIEKEAVLAGGGEKFDIWKPEAWQQQQQATAPNYQTILKRMGL